MAEIDRLLTVKPTSKLPKFTDEQITEFLRQECEDFCDALTSDPKFARQEIQKRIKKLVLTPKGTPAGHVLEVSGDVALLRTGDVLVESLIQRTSEQYIGVLTPLAGINPEACAVSCLKRPPIPLSFCRYVLVFIAYRA